MVENIMGLSLKKEKMAEYLENAKAQDENFKCMLWGTVIAKLPKFEGRTLVSKIMFFTPAPGIGGSMPNNAFCYIGVTEKSFYVIALDAYDTSKIIGTFMLPFADITSFAARKAFLGGSHVVEIECEGHVHLTVKNTSIGTNIKDQKERVAAFLAEMETLKGLIGNL
jgi:hypothetical protein